MIARTLYNNQILNNINRATNALFNLKKKLKSVEKITEKK